MRCANCGNELKAGSLYCDVCGHPVQIVPDYNEFDDYLDNLVGNDEPEGVDFFSMDYEASVDSMLHGGKPVPDRYNSNVSDEIIAGNGSLDKEIINKLYNLKALDVSYCNITDISFVLNLPKLEEFSYLGHDTHGIDLKCLNEHPNYDETWMKD